MSESIKWIFDGIGTEVFILMITLILGGIGGFAIGKHTKCKQTQKAGDSSMQKQTFTVDNGNVTNSKQSKVTSSISQKQEAGNNSEQIQTGRVKHER